MIERMRCRVSSLTPGRPLRANETAPGETPAMRAISAMVTRFPGVIGITLLDRFSLSKAAENVP